MQAFAGRLLCLAIALLWSVAGVSKAASLLFPNNSESLEATWAAQFPTPLLLLVSLAEIMIGIMIIAGYRRKGVILGILLLGLFSITVIAIPPTEAQTCGCLGDLASLNATTLLVRVVLLTGIHTLTFALITVPTAQIEPVNREQPIAF